MTTPDSPAVPALTSRALYALPGVRHAFFTREGGVSLGLYRGLNGGVGSRDVPAAVAENRRRMAATLGLPPHRLASLHQVHSAVAVSVARAPLPSERPEADGQVTAAPGLALAVATADCGPVLFADGEARVVGAAHAGWKGAIDGVLENTIAAMERLGAHRSRMVAALGPMLSQANYEVGPEFVARFLAQDSANAAFFIPAERAGHARFDLPGYLRRRLEAAGVAHVDDLGLCTYADEARFYSYRRATHRGEPDYGRLISAIALAD